MTEGQREEIRASYLRGDAAEEIAAAASVSLEETEIFLHWWCDRGCPDGDPIF
jgi:hypothetical protein